MARPLIGLTCQLFPEPIPRSSVNQQYIDAVIAAGGVPLLIPIGSDGEALDRIYPLLDGLLLPGGDDVAPERYGQERHAKLGEVSEKRDELELLIARRALKDELPILGICRGVQVLAVAAGGTLWQDVPSQYEASLRHDVREHGRDHLCHSIDVEDDSRLAAAIGSTQVTVNSFHHQAVRDIPEGFRVTARAHDGVVEAIETSNGSFAVGVQCHPEGMWKTTAPEFAGLFRAFVEAAQARAASTHFGVQ
ncbi:MAG TPA: gamma-glutamyl-gamma-aminobutyrate hydrolase family protein [Chloroflexota bacterium]